MVKIPKISSADGIVARGGTFGSGFVPDPRPAGLARIQEDLEFLRTNTPAGRPVGRPAPDARNMTSAQKGALEARKGKKKDKKKDNAWPVADYGSLPSDGYKKGSKKGMR